MVKDISHKVKTNMAKLFCRVFANCILELMPTLYGHITTVSFFYLYHVMSANVKLDVSRHKPIKFHGCKLHEPCSFLLFNNGPHPSITNAKLNENDFCT